MNIAKAILAGIIGTAAMTLVATKGAPMMGLPKMDVAGMLSMKMGVTIPAGWLLHFMIGIALAIGYSFSNSIIPGPAAVKGALFGIAPWFLAQIAVMPMMGMGLFSGAFAPAFGSLIGHLVFGAIVGLVYASPACCKTCSA